MAAAGSSQRASRGAAPEPISVVVPFLDAERTLERCLRSLLDQDDPAFEVIAVDDGSRDGSAGILEALRAEHPRGTALVPLRPGAHGGAQRARMEGVRHARGAIVALIDADCEAPAGWLATIRSLLGPDCVAVGGRPRIPPGMPWIARFETYALEDIWLRHMPSEPDSVTTSCCAVHRRHLTPEVLEAGTEYADLTSGDDTVWSLALAAQGRLRYDESLFVYHHARVTLRGYLDQQYRRGRSRARITRRHFDAKVRRAGDMNPGWILAQLASGAASALLGPGLLALGAPGWAALSFAPFAALQLPLLARVRRAGEDLSRLPAALGLAWLRNLAWVAGGLHGALEPLDGRRAP